MIYKEGSGGVGLGERGSCQGGLGVTTLLDSHFCANEKACEAKRQLV